MRQAKTCPACGKHCAPAALDCDACGYALDHVDISILAEAPPAAAAQSPEGSAKTMPCGHACVPTRQPDGTCFDCGRRLEAVRDSVRVWIHWPWQARTEVGESLCIGRVPPAPPELAARLECNFDNVSRRHATLTLDGDTLSVCDHGSANGTFLDGKRLAPHIPTPVAPGASLRFAADLAVSFTWERTPAEPPR
jgi:hypothetical protein